MGDNIDARNALDEDKRVCPTFTVIGFDTNPSRDWLSLQVNPRIARLKVWSKEEAVAQAITYGIEHVLVVIEGDIRNVSKVIVPNAAPRFRDL